MEFKNVSGIYKIENIINGNCYVGQAVNLHKRKVAHFNDLKRNCHHNKYLQRAYNKYGKDIFLFSVILICDKSSLTLYEQAMVDKLCPKYNICRECVNSSLGVKASDETKLKLSKIHSGKKKSKDTKDSMKKNHFDCKGENNPFFGMLHTDEYKKYISYLNIGLKKIDNTSSKYTGVTFCKNCHKWRARVTYNHKRITIGFFLREVDAVMAYNKKMLELYGESARINDIKKEDKCDT